MTEADERKIEEQAEEIEPGSADRLEESREAIDEATSAAQFAANQDVTDVEFDQADSGPAGAEDEAEDEKTQDDDTQDPDGAAGFEEGETADELREGDAADGQQEGENPRSDSDPDSSL